MKMATITVVYVILDKREIMSENKGFTIVKNDIINSGKISLKALGLFLYLKSKPKDWRFSTIRIKNDIKDGLSSINTSMRELESLRLLERRKVKNERGQFEISYIFLDEEPVIEIPSMEKPVGGFSVVGETVVGKPINNKKTESTKKEIEIIIEQEEIQPSETGSLFEVPEEPKQKPKPVKKTPTKSPPKKENTEEGKLYSAMTKIYFEWFEKLSGVKPNFNSVEGSSLKKIINYFKILNKDNKVEGEGNEFDEVTKMFQFILTNWNLIDTFYQKQTKLQQINSNLQNIINDIKNGHKRKSTSTSKDKSNNARGERLQSSFNRIDEMLAKK